MFTINQKKKALKLYEGCKSVTKVIQILGYPSRQTLYKWIDNNGSPPKKRIKTHNSNTPDHPRHPSIETKLKIISRCFEHGEDIKSVSEEVGYSRISIYKWRRDYITKGVIGLMNTKDIPRGELKEGKTLEANEIGKLQEQIADLRMEIDILKETINVLKKDPGINLMMLKNSEKTVIVDALRGIYSLSKLLNRLGLSRSSYYHNHKFSNTDKYLDIRERIVELFNDNNKRYGYRRIHALLRRENIIISEKIVRRIMKEENLIIKQRKTSKYNSYQGEISPEVPNIIDRDFHADKKNEKWLTDITEFAIAAGKVFLSPIVDCFDGYLPSWTIGISPNAELVNSMLDKAIDTLYDGEKPIVHSDRGCQYRWNEWIEKMNQHQLTRSMSKKGCSPDNSACEGLFGRIKNEFFYNRDWTNTTIEEFSIELNDYLIWYNEKRIKQSLGYLSPLEYRQSLGICV